MIFRSITIGNLFCYNKVQTLDLAGPAPNRTNVALVIGRNGYGKTSLLKAVKLLFLGSENKELRQIGFPPKSLQRNEYILGKPGRWLGIRNRLALHDKAEDFFIEAVLDAGERTVTITRQFIFDKSGRFDQEILRYDDGVGGDFTDRAAQDRLDTLLPADLVPFFFFDGEEIQYLAEAPDAERQVAMERLLRLNFLTGVEEAVGTLARDWLRAELPEEIRGKIAVQESECAKLAGEQARLTGENQRLDMEEGQLAVEIDRLARRMEGLRSVGAVANTAELEQKIALLSRELEERQNALATEVAADAPLLVAPGRVVQRWLCAGESDMSRLT
ncbi:MAG TPA: AAA family ATPase, partial [Azospirillaceae bacterium]|nr:AAA family ATPase [Azospirillaceae bacterium]